MLEQEYFDEDWNIRDSVYGVITGSCRSGVFLKLKNGQKAFAFFGDLNLGDEVLCTIRKPATENRRILVSIDSILEKAGTAA